MDSNPRSPGHGELCCRAPYRSLLRRAGGGEVGTAVQPDFFCSASHSIEPRAYTVKSTLFRAISGIWPYGRGTIDLPADASIMLLPQRPYVPSGTLKTAVAYPSVAGTYSDEAVREALELARLASLACEIDSEDNWPQRLSGGEQQRLAIARAILDKPDWLFLDEATSALDEKLEAEIYRMLREVLPNTTIVSIGHRSTLIALHRRHLEMQPGQGGIFELTPTLFERAVVSR